MNEIDVLIVGAGPAGSVCANLLRQSGMKCLLIDMASFPRDKICGGGLTVKAWLLLDKYMPGIKYEYERYSSIQLLIDGKSGCDFEAEHEIRMVSRRDFDCQLLHYYTAGGGEFRHDSPRTICEQPDGRIQVTLKSGLTVLCRYLVGADGSNSCVRHYLTGRKDRGILAMEQYVAKGTYNDRPTIVADVCRCYGERGYFFRFLRPDAEVIGYGDTTMTIEKFRQVLRDRHLPEGKVRGAYVYISSDYPLHDHIILIGDAGGFANRITCEGISYAFMTAANAAKAITENVPFRIVNAEIFDKKQKEERVARFFYSSYFFAGMRLMSHFPCFIKWCYDNFILSKSYRKADGPFALKSSL